MALIMVVDDSPEIVLLIKDLLITRGHQVITAYDGVEMIEKAKNLHPHLIIADLMMPGTYGSAAYKTLQDDPNTAKIPIVFLTAVPPDQARRIVPVSSQVRLLFKPLDAAAMMAAVAALLGDTDATHAPPQK